MKQANVAKVCLLKVALAFTLNTRSGQDKHFKQKIPTKSRIVIILGFHPNQVGIHFSRDEKPPNLSHPSSNYHKW